MMTVTRKFHCSDCGHAWEIPYGTGRPEGCPACKSMNFHRVEPERGFGRRFREGAAGGVGGRFPEGLFREAARHRGGPRSHSCVSHLFSGVHGRPLPGAEGERAADASRDTFEANCTTCHDAGLVKSRTAGWDRQRIRKALVEVVVGFWFLASLPREVMLLFMGRSASGTVLFAAGLLLTALVLLTAFKRRVLPTVVLTVVLVYLMTFLRDFVRTGYLAPVFSPGQLKVVPQYGPMVLFAVTLVAGLSVLAWMVLKAKEAVSGSPGG